VFRLVNHGVPRDLTARLFRLTLDLLDTDPGEKELPGYFGGTPALSLRVKENVADIARIARKLFDALADGGAELALDAAQRPAGASTWWSTAVVVAPPPGTERVSRCWERCSMHRVVHAWGTSTLLMN
jgi:hypothetical protein